MKNCKLVNSQSVKRKADRLNPDLNYHLGGWHDKHSFVIIEDGNIHTIDSHHEYNNIDLPEITQADFLALPEPLKVGDWVKLDNLQGEVFISTIREITGKGYFVLFNKAEWFDREITKLTLDQIKLLNVEGKNEYNT